MSGGKRDVEYMADALALARRAAAADEVPVGALVMLGSDIIGEGWNSPVARHDPTAHAEILAMRAAAQRVTNYRLEGATLYVTMEPCVMCIGAALNARIHRVVFGAWDAKAGACGSVLDVPRTAQLTHRIDVFGGVRSEECAALLKSFFAARRQTN